MKLQGPYIFLNAIKLDLHTAMIKPMDIKIFQSKNREMHEHIRPIG